VTEPIQLTDDVTLRLIRIEDAASVAEAYVRNRAHLAPWDPERPEEFFTEQWQAAELPKQLANYAAGSMMPWVLIDGDRVVGKVTFSTVIRGPLQSAVLGYWLDADYNGKGIVSRAVAEIIRIARDEMGLHRIEAGTLVHNVASQRVLQKAGFEQFGLAPNYLKIGGKWQDHKLFQIILHD
jgi:ribosomal-protein-alanine N-acetyltransferase